MEKEILTKIYTLRKIKADAEWKEEAKKEIFLSSPVKRTKERESFLFSPLFENNGLVMAGALAFLLIFTYSALPLLPEYDNQYVYSPIEVVMEEDISVVPEEDNDIDKNSKSVAVAERPIEEEYSALQNTVRDVQRAVFGMMIKGDSESEYQKKENLTDEDIAKYLIAKMKEDESIKEEGEEMMMLMTTEEDVAYEDGIEDKIERAEKALEDKDYGKIFDIYLEEI